MYLEHFQLFYSTPEQRLSVKLLKKSTKNDIWGNYPSSLDHFFGLTETVCIIFYNQPCVAIIVTIRYKIPIP